MKKKAILLFLLMLIANSYAQKRLTLEECYDLAEKNYPLSKQAELLQLKSKAEIEALHKGKLPKIDLNAQATYQSDVIGLPITLPGVQPLNKEQYRATVDVNQIVFNGGIIEANAKVKETQTKTQQQQIEVSLYQLKSRIHQYFFSIVLLQEKSALLVAKKELLRAKIKEVQSGVQFGALLPLSEQTLEAEIIKINQQLTEIAFENNKLISNLSELTFSPIEANTTFTLPQSFASNPKGIRPEITLYELQKEQIELTQKVITKSTLPKINAFGQAGYGNPGLNMLDNALQSFYVVGLKANWNVWDWGKSKTEKKALDIAKDVIITEKESFELNNKMQLEDQEWEIKKMEQLLVSDKEMIQMREKIEKTSAAKLKNGVITTAEYLVDITNLFEAKNVMKTHEIQLAAAKSNYTIIKGI